MKKVADFIKPNILIIFGALLFLFYLNFLDNKGGTLAIGIIGVVLAVYYLAIGILSLVLGDKLSTNARKIFDVISVCLFAAFMFTVLLISTIQNAQREVYVSFEETKPWMGPTAWTVAILSMIASLALAVIYPIYRFAGKPALQRFAYLFSAVFALALLLDILFESDGSAVVLGNLSVLLIAIYTIFIVYLFGSLGQGEATPDSVPEAPKEENE